MSQMLLTRDADPVAPVSVPAPPRATRPRLAAGGLVLALAVLGLGVVMRDNATFSRTYVTSQLSQQRISFPPVDALAPEERETPCLVRNAGKALATGKQAECYANAFIGRHLTRIAGGKTYAEMRGVLQSLQAQVAEAQAAGAPNVGDLQRQLGAATGQRQALLEGESMRGLLLTSFGFATLGEKAAQAATAAGVIGTGLAIASLGLLVAGRRRLWRSPGRAGTLSGWDSEPGAAG